MEVRAVSATAEFTPASCRVTTYLQSLDHANCPVKKREHTVLPELTPEPGQRAEPGKWGGGEGGTSFQNPASVSSPLEFAPVTTAKLQRIEEE